jgi:hypothetical protein
MAFVPNSTRDASDGTIEASPTKLSAAMQPPIAFVAKHSSGTSGDRDAHVIFQLRGASPLTIAATKRMFAAPRGSR